MKIIDSILDDEKVIWEGKPEFLPFIVGNSVGSVFFGLIWMAFLSPFMFVMGPLVLILPHFWIGIAFLANPIYQLLLYRNVYYAITDKRVIIQKGVIGIDFDSIDYDKITNVDVDVDFVDVLFGKSTGSIKISTPSSFTITRYGKKLTPYTLSHIREPYKVFKMLKKILFDVKTDIYYPNKYRPDENPGYRTKYRPR